MGEHAPVLPAHKIPFVKTRFLQTLTGGLRLSAPPWVILLQLVIFTLPIVAYIPMDMTSQRWRSSPSLNLTATQSLQQMEMQSTLQSPHVLLHMLFGGVLLAEYLLARSLPKCAGIGHQRAKIKPVSAVNKMLQDEEDCNFSTTAEVLSFVIEHRSYVEILLETNIAFALGFSASLAMSTPQPSIVLKTLSLITIANAAYSLCIRQAIEVAQWRRGRFASNRALWVIIASVAHFTFNALLPDFLPAFVFLSFLAGLPLLWSFGVLPTVDTVCEWAVEQIVIHIFGCSIAPTLERLFENFALSVVGWMILWIASANGQTVAGLCVGTLWVYFIAHGIRLSGATRTMHTQPTRNKLMVISSQIVATICAVILGSIGAEQQMASTVLSGLIIVLTSIFHVYREARKPYICGCVRLRKGHLSSLGHQSSFLGLICWIHRLLQLSWMSSVAMLVPSQHTLVSSAILIGGIRRALIDPSSQGLAILFAQLSVESRITDNVFVAFFFSFLALDRFTKFLSKSQAAYLIIVTSSSFVQWTVTRAVLLAFGTCVAAGCSVLDAPILPIFGTPIVFIGFPRPKRFWPAYQEVRNSEEGAYYEQVLEQVKGTFECLEDLKSGMIYVIKIEKLVIYVLITEVGLGYFEIVIKGLELQEATSCHHLEAGFLDTIIDSYDEAKKAGNQLERGEEKTLPQNCCLEPAAPLCLGFTLLFHHEFVCYEETKIRLTGIVENPDFHAVLNKAFLYTLIFFLEKLSEEDMQEFCQLCQLLRAENKEFPDAWLDYRISKPGANTVAPQGPIGPPGDDFNASQETGQGRELESELDDLLDEMDTLWQLESGVTSASSSTNAQQPKGNGSFTCPDAPSQEAAFSRSDLVKTAALFVQEAVNSHGFPMEDVQIWGSSHLCACFKGEFPEGADIRRLRSFDTVDMNHLAIRAYRLAFKLALDAYTSYDPDPSLSELEDVERSIEQILSHSHLGLPGSDLWSEGVKNGTENLIALRRKGDQNVEELLQLKLGKRKGWVFRVKEEVAYALWANLGLELRYATCDDDERFSVQASPRILRNLSIQAADVPLGYPIFQTGSIRVRRNDHSKIEAKGLPLTM